MEHKLPQQLLTKLEDVTGFNKEAFLNAHEGEAITSVRFNPSKPLVDEHFIDGQIVSWCEYGRYLPKRPSFTLDPVFHGGAYYVQEASSMFLHHLIKHLYGSDTVPNHVLDLCAAPGGKSTLLASALPDSFIVSNEVIKTRVSVLAENIAKWGSDHVVVTNNDPKDFQRLPAFFDLMVVDAPCSGSGLFRKDANAINEWSESNVQLCSMRQQRILTEAIPSLRKDGYLVYSTCSYSQQENEEICDWIVDTFKLTPVQIPIEPSWGIVETLSDKHKAQGYRFYPDKVKGEGFFIACFKQENPVEEYYAMGAKLQVLVKGEKALVEEWLQEPSNYVLFNQKDNIIATPARWADTFSIIQKNLSVRKSGVAIGNIKGKDLIPHHEFALSNLLHQNIPFIEVNKEEALKYLKRQDLVLSSEKRGWTLIRHQGINLGWAKLLPTRVNNYYPTNWRILIP